MPGRSANCAASGLPMTGCRCCSTPQMNIASGAHSSASRPTTSYLRWSFTRWRRHTRSASRSPPASRKPHDRVRTQALGVHVMIHAPGMEAMVSLSAASFLTSLLTAAIGIGGGLGLLSVMPSFITVAAVVPLHGMTQFVSNASRFVFDYRQAETHLLPAYFTGACLGSLVGYLFIGRIPELYLSAALGLFILLFTWTGLLPKL